MVPRQIELPREYFDYVVTPDVNELKTRSSDLRSAFHACTSLLSLRDWVLHNHRGATWMYASVHQRPFSSATQLQTALEALDRKFAIVTDIANANKHMVLDQRRSRTNLYGNANTEVREDHGGAIGSGAIGAAPIGGTSRRIVVKIDQTYHDVLPCVTAAYAVWEQLMNENGW